MEEIRNSESKYVNSVLCAIKDEFNAEELGRIRKALVLSLQDYDIVERETSLAEYTGYLPECMMSYFVNLKISGLSENTIKSYKQGLGSLFRYLDRDVTKITPNAIRAALYQVQEQTGCSNVTLDQKRIALNTFLEWCCNEGYIPSNPCRAVRPIKCEKKERGSLTQEEFEQLRNAATSLRDRALVDFFFSTGARVSEVANCDISDVNFDTNEVKLFGKGRKERIDDINVRCRLSLKAYIKSRDDDNDALFVSQRKPYKRLTNRGIELIIQKLGKQAGIDRPVYPHLIRHTTATVALERGMPVTEIQQMLGHANVSTTMIYAQTARTSVKNDHHKYVY